jgi:hypothetical protein
MLTNDMLRQLASDHGDRLRREADSELVVARRLQGRRHPLELRRRITNRQAAPSRA